MEEKIKVSIPKAVLDVLKKDCADFKVTKANGSPNMNAFYNILLSNFYEEFANIEEKTHDAIRAAVAIVPDYYREKVFLDTVRVFTDAARGAEGKQPSAVFAFKPSKISEKAVLYIEKILLKNESISSFYRRLFSAYAQKTKNEREKIIHKENYELLQKALRKGVKVCLALQSGDVIESASLHSVTAAKDELFNYVLCHNGKQNVTVRLASVRSVSLLPAKSEIPEDCAALFARQVACAAQYPMYASDREPIRVQLSEKGKKLFEKIYLYRPTPVSVDGDVYTFDCSANQLLYYFERFGDSALILSPKKLGIFMRNYYYFAYKKYKSLYFKD